MQLGRGKEGSLGETAVILVQARLLVVLTSKPAFSNDPAVLSSQGLDISSLTLWSLNQAITLLNRGDLGAPLLVPTRESATIEKASSDMKEVAFGLNILLNLGRSLRRHLVWMPNGPTLGAKAAALLSITEPDVATRRTGNSFHQREPAQRRKSPDQLSS